MVLAFFCAQISGYKKSGDEFTAIKSSPYMLKRLPSKQGYLHSFTHPWR